MIVSSASKAQICNIHPKDGEPHRLNAECQTPVDCNTFISNSTITAVLNGPAERCNKQVDHQHEVK